ncbi:PREDICTED: uncharacterized protein LOC108563792 [Nicrophorus vespilloides]|uniref:Uncharacterized protein LOC108563792 n=1 Tax=Nicrophorus vespilloides TaxID=110193 RepID=A0ABM1MU12_NICVS|nr:PREDICTED: uncharacterized protein LOC108563792 [Nicrophorus vespilloides]
MKRRERTSVFEMSAVSTVLLLVVVVAMLATAQYRPNAQFQNPGYAYYRPSFYPQIPHHIPPIPPIPPISQYGQIPWYPYPMKPSIPNDPYAKIPTEIVDIDGEVTTQTPLEINNFHNVQIGDKSVPSNQGTSFTNRTIHIVESKPIISKFHRVITSDGTKSQSLNIHMYNGVEVTTSTSTTTRDYDESTTSNPTEEEEVSSEDPKPVNSWIFG